MPDFLEWMRKWIPVGQHAKPETQLENGIDQEESERLRRIEEIRRALMMWENARNHFEFALDKDEVDYAVYALEAAEKRYSMLLRQAKKLNVYDKHWML